MAWCIHVYCSVFHYNPVFDTFIFGVLVILNNKYFMYILLLVLMHRLFIVRFLLNQLVSNV